MDIHITNLHLNVKESDLQRLFTPYGEVRSVIILRDQRNNRSRGRAVVDMPVPKQAENAIISLNGTIMEGKSIHVTSTF